MYVKSNEDDIIAINGHVQITFSSIIHQQNSIKSLKVVCTRINFTIFFIVPSQVAGKVFLLNFLVLN